MAAFVFTSGTNSFTMKIDNKTSHLRNLTTRFDNVSPGNDQVLFVVGEIGKRSFSEKINLNIDSVDVDGTTVFADAAALDAALEPLFFLASGGGGGGGGGDSFGAWRYASSTTMADPGSGFFRLNNATQSSATAMALSDINRGGTDMGFALNLISNGDFFYMQESSDATKAQVYQVSGAPVDNGTWFQFPIVHVQQGTSPLDTNTNIGFIIIYEGSAPSTAINVVSTYDPDRVEVTNSADWHLNSPAPIAKDTANNALLVNTFDDTIAEAVGFTERIPLGATNITFFFKFRAQTSPPGSRTIVVDIRTRREQDNTAIPGTWTLSETLTLTVPTTSVLWQYRTETIALTAITGGALIAGDVYKFQYIIQATGTLVDDAVFELYQFLYT